MEQTLTIPDSFGQRLRAERERLGLSQTALASIAGIRRLAQSQYEKETSSPNVRYLSAVGSAGLNLEYIVFGRLASDTPLTTDDTYRIEGEAFRLLEEFVQKQPGSQMGVEGRFALFQVFRENLTKQLKSHTTS